MAYGLFDDADEYVVEAIKGKPELVVHIADRPATVRALLNVLKTSADLFDRGGVLVRLIAPADGGLPIARPMTVSDVVWEAHQYCQPARLSQKGETVEITLPNAVARMLLDRGEWGVPPLAGITTAPLLAPDGSILVHSGYNPDLAMWCDRVSDLSVPNVPTRAQAEAALALLRKTFRTFPFAGSPTISRGMINEVDVSKPASAAESAFLAALLTACCRPSLPLAPGLLIVAPAVSGAGSGKGLLARAVCEIAYGSQPSAFTAGHDRDELDKRLVAALIEATPAVFLDNVNGTALRSNTLANILTERPARVRMLGRTQMVPLNCTSFIIVTGNGLSVSEDLARRFLDVPLDPQCEDPEARPFAPGFLDNIAAHRSTLLAAALTIWRWGRQNARLLTRGLPLGSFETWAEWVRDPLVTLGCQDPVERVRLAKSNDPRRQKAAHIFATWWEHHENLPIFASQLAKPVQALIDPQQRGRQFITAWLAQQVGARIGGFVLTVQPGTGNWGRATYAVMRTAVETIGVQQHRDHRGHRTDAMPDECPVSPMPPMPDGDAGETEGWL